MACSEMHFLIVFVGGSFGASNKTWQRAMGSSVEALTEEKIHETMKQEQNRNILIIVGSSKKQLGFGILV